MRPLFAALLLLLCSGSGHAVLWGGSTKRYTPSTYPNPLSDPQACGRKGVNSSRICDPDGILPLKTANVRTPLPPPRPLECCMLMLLSYFTCPTLQFVEGILNQISGGEKPYAKIMVRWSRMPCLPYMSPCLTRPPVVGVPHSVGKLRQAMR